MVLPLKKITQKGKPYNRRNEIEDTLNKLDGLAPDHLVKQLTCTQQKVPFEVLIYYLRHSELMLSEHHFESIFVAFYSRLESVLRKAVPEAWDYAITIREEIAERVVEMIAQDRNSQEEKMYYWETNFNHALANLIKDVLKVIGPARETDPLINAKPLEHTGEEGYEIDPEVDSAASDFFNLNPSKLDDPAFRLRLINAINTLPDDERRAVGLYLRGMQIEAQDPGVMTIAKALECTDRTVRNQLRRAYEKLRVILQEEDIA